MATTLGEEVRHVQNPALGALLEWRFAVGYEEVRNDAAGCPLPLLFLVLPILLHQETLQHVVSTRRSSGLRAFAAKFSTTAAKQSDVLLSLNSRARAMRPLSLESLRVAIGARLMSLDRNAAVGFALTKAAPRASIPETVSTLAQNAEKIGHWCGTLTLVEIATIIRVHF